MLPATLFEDSFLEQKGSFITPPIPQMINFLSGRYFIHHVPFTQKFIIHHKSLKTFEVASKSNPKELPNYELLKQF